MMNEIRNLRRSESMRACKTHAIERFSRRTRGQAIYLFAPTECPRNRHRPCKQRGKPTRQGCRTLSRSRITRKKHTAVKRYTYAAKRWNFGQVNHGQKMLIPVTEYRGEKIERQWVKRSDRKAGRTSSRGRKFRRRDSPTYLNLRCVQITRVFAPSRNAAEFGPGKRGPTKCLRRIHIALDINERL